jgi:quinol monooxygenase YgiN
MSFSVLVAIAGVLVAAVVTGVLIGRCIRRPAPGLAAWAVGTLGLTAALLALGAGFVSGFSPLTFRVAELGAQLVAPLWLAWGLVELAARGEAARIAMRLATGALTLVGGVVLATDPLAAKPFGRTWTSAAGHYQLIAHDMLMVVQVAAALATAAIAVRRMAGARGGPAPQLAPAAVAAGGIAVLLAIAIRFTLPADSAYPALGAAAAALIWFAAARRPGLAGSLPAGPRGPGREWRDEDPVAAGSRDRGYGPGGFYGPGGPDEPPMPAGTPMPAGRRAGGRQPPGEGSGYPGDAATRQLAGSWRPGGYQGPGGPGGPGAVTRALEAPGTATGLAPLPAAPEAAAPEANGGREAPQAPPYGLIAIYTLLEDKVADFDRLAARVADEVRGNEPDTLVYIIHTVPKAPLQRIFYEVYRDKEAFESHERQPYIRRFATERRPCVLATNVIELRLNYAKVSPLRRARAPQATRVPQAPQRGYGGA